MQESKNETEDARNLREGTVLHIVWWLRRSEIKNVINLPTWFEDNKLRSLGITALHCKDDDLTGVMIHSRQDQIRITFGVPCQIVFVSEARSLDIGTDVVAQDLARKCREYFTAHLNITLPANAEVVQKLKTRWL